MDALVQIGHGDRRLLTSIAASMDEAARRSGEWLVCRPGCTQCCIGLFAITQLDAMRLREGLARIDAKVAERVRTRARSVIEAIAPEYPGDAATGQLLDEDSLRDSTDSVACPALDPETGLCDLYESRPITCRTFGPVTPVANDAVAACELCYEGATEEQMERCAVEIDPEGLECDLLARLAAEGIDGMTIVAYALAR